MRLSMSRQTNCFRLRPLKRAQFQIYLEPRAYAPGFMLPPEFAGFDEAEEFIYSGRIFVENKSVWSVEEHYSVL